MKNTTRWMIRIPVTCIALVLVASFGTEKTLDPGSMGVLCLLIIAGTVWMWIATRRHKGMTAP